MGCASDPEKADAGWRGSGSLTVENAIFVLQFAGYLLELGLASFVLLRRRQRGFVTLCIYLAVLLAADGVTRPYVLYRYGFNSHQYAYFFWLTDVLLALAAFLLLCSFFRRACLHEEKMWRFLRLFLAFVFILVLGISSVSLAQNYSNLFGIFIVEFQQNLYFTCLVLTTLLFVLIERLQRADEQLALLVVGVGIQFAGPTASLALLNLARGQEFAGSIVSYLGPLCNLGMLLTWSYALTQVPEAAGVPAREEGIRELVAVPSRKT
jgi:hypothetical protein